MVDFLYSSHLTGDQRQSHRRPDRARNRGRDRYIYDPAGVPFDDDKREVAVDNLVSGYIRYIDTRRLLYLAKAFKFRVRTLRRVGHFVPAGVALFGVSPAERLDSDRAGEPL